MDYGFTRRARLNGMQDCNPSQTYRLERRLLAVADKGTAPQREPQDTEPPHKPVVLGPYSGCTAVVQLQGKAEAHSSGIAG